MKDLLAFIWRKCLDLLQTFLTFDSWLRTQLTLRINYQECHGLGTLQSYYSSLHLISQSFDEKVSCFSYCFWRWCVQIFRQDNYLSAWQKNLIAQIRLIFHKSQISRCLYHPIEGTGALKEGTLNYVRQDKTFYHLGSFFFASLSFCRKFTTAPRECVVSSKSNLFNLGLFCHNIVFLEFFAA